MKKKFSTFVIILLSMASYAQDIIVTTKSERIESKVEEVSAEQIKYRKLINLNGPLFAMPTSEILEIHYANGEVQIFNKTDNMATKVTEGEITENESSTKEDKKDKGPSKFTVYLECSGIVGKEVIRTKSTNDIPGYNVTLKPVIGGPELQLTFGGTLGELCFLGAGVGINSAFGNVSDEYDQNQKMSIRAITIPVYMNSRVFIPLRNSSFRPNVDVSIGLCTPPRVETDLTYLDETGNYKKVTQSQRGDVSAFFRVGFGGEFKRFVFGIGYELWGNKGACDHYAYFKVGHRFGGL